MPALLLFLIWVLFLIFQRNQPEDVGLPAIEKYHGEMTAEESAKFLVHRKLRFIASASLWEAREVKEVGGRCSVAIDQPGS